MMHRQLPTDATYCSQFGAARRRDLHAATRTYGGMGTAGLTLRCDEPGGPAARRYMIPIDRASGGESNIVSCSERAPCQRPSNSDWRARTGSDGRDGAGGANATISLVRPARLAGRVPCAIVRAGCIIIAKCHGKRTCRLPYRLINYVCLNFY